MGLILIVRLLHLVSISTYMIRHAKAQHEQCLKKGYVFLPNLEQKYWAGTINCEPLQDPASACNSKKECIGFTSTGWLYSAPPCKDCKDEAAGRHLMAALAVSANTTYSLLREHFKQYRGLMKRYKRMVQLGACGSTSAAIFQWEWVTMKCSSKEACCGSYVMNDEGDGAAFANDVAEESSPALPVATRGCRCPAKYKTQVYKTQEQYDQQCRDQFGSPRGSLCRVAMTCTIQQSYLNCYKKPTGIKRPKWKGYVCRLGKPCKFSSWSPTIK